MWDVQVHAFRETTSRELAIIYLMRISSLISVCMCASKKRDRETERHDQEYYCTKEWSGTPDENSFDGPRCEQLVPKSFGYEDVKNSLQNRERAWCLCFFSVVIISFRMLLGGR
jgi:hypothetical protein